MTAIGVLCARVRVEEKQIIAALADAGRVVIPVPPASTPLPPGPARLDLAASESSGPDDGSQREARVIIDRCQNRHLASATLPLLKAGGIITIDAGLASTGTRLQIATALSQASLPRPETFIGMSEAASIDAVARLGFPATLLPQTPGTSTTALIDNDTAEAVIEHRVVLGTHGEAIVVIQRGAPTHEQHGRHHVVAGQVIATEGGLVDRAAQTLAVRAALALDATAVSIDIAHVDGHLVIWDVVPVTDFRSASLTGSRTVGQAMADAVTELERRDTNAPDPTANSVSAGPQDWEVQVESGDRHISLTA